jgi:hypothetical protein
VNQSPVRAEVAEVAACTVTAAHGRDHDHALEVQCCHPHAVQVVYLGHRALTVCHDCRVDSGFLPYREAERLAEGHRDQTRAASEHLMRRCELNGSFGRSSGYQAGDVPSAIAVVGD